MVDHPSRRERTLIQTRAGGSLNLKLEWSVRKSIHNKEWFSTSLTEVEMCH